MKYIIGIIGFLICDYIFFIIIAKISGKKSNYDCTICNNWACTHTGKYEKQGCYPVKDWSRWCLK